MSEFEYQVRVAKIKERKGKNGLNVESGLALSLTAAEGKHDVEAGSARNAVAETTTRLFFEAHGGSFDVRSK